jgi:hypothetical protein
VVIPENVATIVDVLTPQNGHRLAELLLEELLEELLLLLEALPEELVQQPHAPIVTFPVTIHTSLEL